MYNCLSMKLNEQNMIKYCLLYVFGCEFLCVTDFLRVSLGGTVTWSYLILLFDGSTYATTCTNACNNWRDNSVK